MTSPERVDAHYVEARRVLLDALSALAPHAPAVIVAGAQAVYLRAGDAEIAVAPYTTDADLAVDPGLLPDEPVLEAVMTEAGFHLGVEPGVWLVETQIDGVDTVIPVDLIVPEGFAPPGGRRGARLGPHGKRAARRAVGLEAALVDHSPLSVSSLDPADDRSIETEVAGAAALLVSKLHKLHERVARRRPERILDKDAADVVRLMQATSPREIAARFGVLVEDEIAGPPSAQALGFLEVLFGRRGRAGIELASRALRIGMPAAQVEALCVSYTGALLAAVRE